MRDVRKLQWFPLDKAFLCADETCKAVGESSCICPACSGHVLMSLARVLDRKEEEKEQRK